MRTINNPVDSAVELVRKMISEYIFDRDKLIVKAKEIGDAIVIMVKPTKGDAPKILGKNGVTFHSLREIVRAIGAKARISMDLQFVEPNEGAPRGNSPFRAAQNWNGSHVVMMLSEVADLVFKEPARVDNDEDDDLNTTSLTLFISAKEQRALAGQMAEALRTVFNAIGKANGRTIIVNLKAV